MNLSLSELIRPRAVQRPDSEELSMSDDSLRDYRDDSHLKIDGAEAADDDNESGYLSVSHDDDQSSSSSDPSLHSDWSNGQIINFKKLEKCDPDRYQRWQHMQKQKKLIQIQEELVLADLPPDCFLSDDDQSSSSSDPSLHSDWSTGKIIDFKKSDKSKPARDHSLPLEREDF